MVEMVFMVEMYTSYFSILVQRYISWACKKYTKKSVNCCHDRHGPHGGYGPHGCLGHHDCHGQHGRHGRNSQDHHGIQGRHGH